MFGFRSRLRSLMPPWLFDEHHARFALRRGSFLAHTYRTSVPSVSRRRCSKPSCTQPAVSTLTYVYADSTAVVGPLATYAEPHCYDLCQMHSDRLTAPKGWEIVRITPDPDALKPSTDDLEALANAVREAAKPRYAPDVDAGPSEEPAGVRRGHLRVVPDVSRVEFPEAASLVPTAAAPSAPAPDVVDTPASPEPSYRSSIDEPFDHERLW